MNIIVVLRFIYSFIIFKSKGSMSRTNCLNHSCVLLVSSLYEYTNRTFREDDNPPLMCTSVLVAKKVNAIVSTVSVARKVFYFANTNILGTTCSPVQCKSSSRV